MRIGILRNYDDDFIKLVTILSPPQTKSLHGGVRCSRSAHLTQQCCDFFSCASNSINTAVCLSVYLSVIKKKQKKCDWLTWISLVILLRLSLVRIRVEVY